MEKIESKICLGTGTFGNSLSQEESFRQISYFLDKGGNFIDTARVYGKSEEVIGEWIKQTKRRDELILCTKGAHPDVNWKKRLKEEDIVYDLDQSLKKLNTDYIDLYLLHRDDPTIPVEEIEGVLAKLEKQGKIRSYGVSNWTSARMREMKNISANQAMLSLTRANEDFLRGMDMVQADKEMVEYHEETGILLMSYMALAGGYFIKKLEGKEISNQAKSLYEGIKENEEMLALIEESNTYTSLQMLIQYVLMQSFRAIPVISFSCLKQIDEAMKLAEKPIDKSTFEKIHKARIEFREE